MVALGSDNIVSASLCAALSLMLVTTAMSAQIENLGQPCRGKNILSGRIVTDRATGRELLAMVDMNETTGAELLFVDFGKNKGVKYHCPGGSGSWALNEVPGDRLVIGTFYDGKFMVFDLRKMEFIKDVYFPGESYIWNLALGGDGRMYGGTYGGGKLGALDLKTYEVEDLGNPAPPNMYCRNVSSLPDGRILSQFGEEKDTVLVFDPTTKKFEPVPKQIEGISAGITWHGYFLAGSRMFKGDSLEPAEPPFPVPPADRGTWYINTSASNDDMLIVQQKNYVYTYGYGEKALTPVTDLDLSSTRIIGVSKKNELLCFKGEDYVVVKPGDKKLNPKRIPVESSPRPTHFLRCDEQGILWGGTIFGQTLWWMDPKTRKYENTRVICNAGGEAYDVACKEGKVYAVTYAGGDIVMYDRMKPWDQLGNVNPKVIASVGREKGYIRPIAGARFGPDGKLYSGWMARYGTYGGAISITDPDTGETRLIENPLGEQAIHGLAVDAAYAYASTTLAGNGLPTKQGESAKFGIVEPATGKVVFEKIFDGASTILVPGYDEPTKRLVLSNGGALMLFDTSKRDFIALPEDTPKLTSYCTAMKDGCLYYGSEKSIVKLDVRRRKFERIAEATGRVSNVALGPDGTVYFSSGADVCAVTTGQ